MKKYLIDVNLPYYFSLWRGEEYVHQRDIKILMMNGQINKWDYASQNNLTIITKDSDFSHRIILHSPPPRVIHIRVGNMKMNSFFNIISNSWNDIKELSESCKLVNVFADRIEGIR